MYRRRRTDQEKDRECVMTENRRLVFKKRSRQERPEKNCTAHTTNSSHALEAHSEPVSPELGNEAKDDQSWNLSPSVRNTAERLPSNRLGSFRWKNNASDSFGGYNDSNIHDERSMRHPLFEKRNLQQVIGEFKAKAMQRKSTRDSQRELNHELRRATDVSPNIFTEMLVGDEEVDIGLSHDYRDHDGEKRKPSSSERNTQGKVHLSAWLQKTGRFKSIGGESQPLNVTFLRRSHSRTGIGRLARPSCETVLQDDDNIFPSPIEDDQHEECRSMRNLAELFTQQGKNIRPLLRQIGKPKDGVRRAKSSDSLYNNYDRHAKTLSDPDVLEEHVTFLTEITTLEQKLQAAEDKFQEFLDDAANKRDEVIKELERLTEMYNSLQSEHELKFRSVVDIFNENNKTVGDVESNFDYLLSIVDRGRARATHEYVTFFLQLLGDRAMETIFRVIQVASDMLTRFRRLWHSE